MKRSKSKCISQPAKYKKTCDGCDTTSTKCPSRFKTRELRASNKQTWKKEEEA